MPGNTKSPVPAPEEVGSIAKTAPSGHIPILLMVLGRLVPVSIPMTVPVSVVRLIASTTLVERAVSKGTPCVQ